jgi:hypothetical protein
VTPSRIPPNPWQLRTPVAVSESVAAGAPNVRVHAGPNRPDPGWPGCGVPGGLSSDLDCSGLGVQLSAQFMAAVFSRAFVIEAQAAAWQGGGGNVTQRASAERAGNGVGYRKVA